MAASPLVTAQDDTGLLLRLSLARHKVPVDDVFEVVETLTGQRYFAVATPIAEKRGFREAYFQIFTAMGHESFAAIPYLRQHTLAISHEELLAIRRAIKKSDSEAILPKLLQLGEVTVRAVDDPSEVFKTGFLIVRRLTKGAYELSFSPMDRNLRGKKRVFDSVDSVKKYLEGLRVSPPSDMDHLPPSQSTSFPMAASLQTLYQQELI